MTIKSMEQSSSGVRVYLNQPWNLIQTGFLILTWIILAFHLELIDTTMPNLATNIHVHYSGMGSVLALRAIGFLVANIFGIILQNIVEKHSEGLLICAFILPAIVVFATPFVTSFIVMCILFFIQGTAQGLTDLGGTNILLKMWGNNAAAPLNSVHFGYGIGAVFVNLLVRSFLSEQISSNDIRNNQIINSTSSSVNTINAISNIVIPYSITAVLCIFIAIGHVYFYIRELRKQREQFEVRHQVDYGTLTINSNNANHLICIDVSSPYSPRTFGRGDFHYGLILSIIFIFYKLFISGDEQIFSKFFFTYLKSEQFHLSDSTANWGTVLYWLSFSIGRLIAAILSLFLSVYICLNIVLFGGLCLSIGWFIFVWNIGLTTTSLFVLGGATGLVFAPLFPLSFAFINQRLNVTSVLVALLLCGTALGSIIFSEIAGFIMDRNPNHFSTLLIVCILISIILYTASNVVYFIHQRKTPLSTQPSITNGAALSLDSLNEDEEQQQMTNRPIRQEDK